MTWIDEDDANFLQVGVAEIFLQSWYHMEHFMTYFLNFFDSFLHYL